MKKYLCVSLALVATIVALGATAVIKTPESIQAAEAYSFKHSKGLHVTATGTVKVKPDFASVIFNVETKHKNVDDARKENAELMSKLIDSLKEHGVNESDTKTTGFYIYPDHDYYRNQIIGHRASNQLTVKVRDIDSVGKIIDNATSAGASMISGIQFGIEDDAVHYNEALIKAVELAKNKAKILAGAVELENIRIVSIKEVSNGYHGFGRFDYVSRCSSGSGHTPVMHNEIEVSATVEIRYELETHCQTNALPFLVDAQHTHLNNVTN
jgi:hypothetical protein